MQRFKFLKHTADIKFQAFGKTLNEAFENSALATFNSINEEEIKTGIKKNIKVSGKDNESLLYNFIEELLFLFETEHFFLSKIKVKITGGELSAELNGDKTENYEAHVHIKAVTYSEMIVKKVKDKWVCQVVLDV